MKKIFLGFLLLAGFMCAAQTKTYIGVKAGGGASTAYMQHSIFPTLMDVGWQAGATAGLQVMHFPHKYSSRFNAGIQIGANWVQKGWVQNFTDKSEKNHKTRINYLEIPIEAVGYFGRKNKYFVTAGIFVEYALSSDVDATPSSATTNPDYPALKKVGVDDFYRYRIGRDNRLNYGPRGSAGIFRETGIGVFRLEGYFSFSIKSVFDSDPIESSVPDLSLNYGAGVTLGYFFSFGKLDL